MDVVFLLHCESPLTRYKPEQRHKGSLTNRLRALWRVTLVTTLFLPVPIHAAGTSGAQARQATSVDRKAPRDALDELDEVIIEGARPTSAIADWFRRMAGSYRATGSLSYLGAPNVAVWGKTDCFVFGTGPGLQCTLNLQSADSKTNMNPGILLFSFDLDRPRIRFMAVEDTGSGEGSIGELRGDTATFRAECAYRGRPCYRTTSITARPNSNEVRMEVSIEVDGTRAAYYEIFMIRLPGTSSPPRNAGAGNASADRKEKRPR